jgi:hypothetical protein
VAKDEEFVQGEELPGLGDFFGSNGRDFPARWPGGIFPYKNFDCQGDPVFDARGHIFIQCLLQCLETPSIEMPG